MSKQITASAHIIGECSGRTPPKVGIILGSGLGHFADQATDKITIPYADLQGFPEPGVAGHKGQLIIGDIEGTSVAIMQGRAHYYENGNADAMKIPVRALKEIGCETLILTNAAGSINPDARPGNIMLTSDHISFTGVSPLFGEQGNDRFVDLSHAYDRDYRATISAIAGELGIPLYDGVYMWFCGPHFETPAEIRAARILGATCVGMSTVPEVILARHAGMRVLALSIITNLAAGMSDTDLSHEQTMRNAEIAAVSVTKLLREFLKRYSG